MVWAAKREGEIYGVRRARYSKQVETETPAGQDVGLKFMKKIEEIIKNLGEHFHKDGWQRAAIA